jgi:hypothetical protein
MSQSVTPWQWTEDRERAAILIAEGELVNQEIATQCSVHRRQILRWKKIPEFAARVKELTEETCKTLAEYAVANKQRRVAELEKRRQLIVALIESRAVAHENAVGGHTGLLTKDIKQIGSGDSAREVEVYSADVALLRELREIEKQAAIECGQWDERPSSGGNQIVQVTIIERNVPARLSTALTSEVVNNGPPNPVA